MDMNAMADVKASIERGHELESSFAEFNSNYTL